MGTKNNPGDFDCYKEADPDEPMFVLRGSDTSAWFVVQLWISIKMAMRKVGTSKITDAKLDEAKRCSEAMRAWADKSRTVGRRPPSEDAVEGFENVVRNAFSPL